MKKIIDYHLNNCKEYVDLAILDFSKDNSVEKRNQIHYYQGQVDILKKLKALLKNGV